MSQTVWPHSWLSQTVWPHQAVDWARLSGSRLNQTVWPHLAVGWAGVEQDVQEVGVGEVSQPSDARQRDGLQAARGCTGGREGGGREEEAAEGKERDEGSSN